MKEVTVGDDQINLTFIRQESDNVIEVVMKKFNETLVEKIKAEDLIIALRFITS